MENGTYHENGEQTSATENIKTLYESAVVYAKTKLDLLKLKTVDKTSSLISSVIAGVAIAFVLIMFFLILNIGIGLLLGELFGKSYYGFFALAGFYLIIGIIFMSLKEKLFKTPVANMMIKKFLKK